MFGISPFELATLAVGLLAAGAVTGLLAGVFGVGGGAVVVPVLYELFRVIGVPEEVRMPLCVGTSLAIIIPTSIRSFNATKLLSCTTGGISDAVTEFASEGQSSLRYDSTASQFIQNWKTAAVSGDTCFRVSVTALDGSAVHAFVRLRK